MKNLILKSSILIIIVFIGCKNESKKQSTSFLVDKENYQSGIITAIGDQPTVVKIDDNVIGVTYGNKETIYYSESKDGGKSFSDAEIVGTLKELVLGRSSGPQIAFTKDALIITAPSEEGNLYAWSKGIKSKVWEGPFRINDLNKSVGEFLSAITATTDGVLYSTWIDTRLLENKPEMDHSNHTVKKEKTTTKSIAKKKIDLNTMTPIGITIKQLYDKIGDVPKEGFLFFHDDKDGNLFWVFKDKEGNVLKAENIEAYKEFKRINGQRGKPKGKIYISSSKDNGKTWSKSQLVYQSPDGSVCECCKPSIITDEMNNIVIMFRNNIDGSRDLYYTKSSDNGVSFSQPQKLGSGTWKINGCPMDGGSLASIGKNELMTVWQREGSIFTANSDLNEFIIGQGNSPSIVKNKESYSLVYTYGNEIMAVHKTNSLPEKIGTGYSAKVLSIEDGIIYIWASDKGIEYKKFHYV